jgi:hypothetical protein
MTTINYGLIGRAISSLRPTCAWGINNDDYNTLFWHEDNKEPAPSREEVEAEIIRIQAELEATQYQRNRAPEYPSIGDQLDALYHAGVFPEEMASLIQQVKNKYPKP